MNAATLRLKMVVNTVSNHVDSNGETQSQSISLTVVYSDKEGSVNKQWSKWTPSGELKFLVSNPPAIGRLLPGQYFFVDLVPTDKDGI